MTSPRPGMSTGERAWRGSFYFLSALMAAFALVDVYNGRFAHALSDIGITCLMLALMMQFPFIRAIVRAAQQQDSQEAVQREVEALRRSNPWVDRLSAAGWLLVVGSLVLRLLGIA